MSWSTIFERMLSCSRYCVETKMHMMNASNDICRTQGMSSILIHYFCNYCQIICKLNDWRWQTILMNFINDNEINLEYQECLFCKFTALWKASNLMSIKCSRYTYLTNLFWELWKWISSELKETVLLFLGKTNFDIHHICYIYSQNKQHIASNQHASTFMQCIHL